MAKWDADKLDRALVQRLSSEEALRQRIDALLCRIQDVEARLDKLVSRLGETEE